MAIDLKTFNTLKINVDRLRSDADKAEGALTQLMTRLKNEHDCSTLDEAEHKLKKLEQQATEDEQEYSQALESFQAEWQEQLDA